MTRRPGRASADRPTNVTLVFCLIAATSGTVRAAAPAGATAPTDRATVLYKTVKVGDLDIFYREAGPKDAPTLLLLHGFPTSSQMFRNLIPALADRYHVVAPDYPGYGYSSMPLARQVRLHLRQPGEGDRRVHRAARADEVRPLRAGLRRADRLPARRRAPGADHRHRGAERQRLRRGTRQRLLEADQGVLEASRAARRSATPFAACSPTRRPSGSTRPARRTRSSSARTERPRISSCSTARATTRSSSTCSSATAATRRSIRSGRSTSASTSRRC